jgi:hypothetical protein
MPEGLVTFLIDIEDQPALAEAVLLLGELFFTSNRVQKYITLYKVYEILEPNPNIDFAVVRHSLSHASTALSRPKTVAKLTELFGGTQINLNISKHIRIFYRQMIQLIVETDMRLYKAITTKASNLRRLGSRQDALYDWQIDGIPRFVNPIPVHDSTFSDL